MSETMMRYIGTVGLDGEARVPAKIREHLGIEPGDRMSFEITESGVLMRRALPPVEDLSAIRPGTPGRRLKLW